MSEYKIPDPKENPVMCLVLAYKTTKGIPYDDKNWDKVHFSRCCKPAKALIEICGSVRVADSCLVDIAKRFDDAGLGWTLETVLKHAHEWLSKKRGNNGNAHRTRFLKALAERGRSEPDNPLRQESGPLLDSIGNLKDPEKGHQKDPD